MFGLFPFLKGDDGKFSLLALLGFLLLLAAGLFAVKKIPPLRAIAAAG